MSKNILIAVLGLAVIGLLWYVFQPATLFAPVVEPGTVATTTDNEDITICAQVITPARNPETGEIREFPTPCDVPEGWEVIQNDIPGFELEVQ